MAIAELHTKRKIVDIKDSEDTIDREYATRMMAVNTKKDIAQIVEDFEDFLPAGLQRLRNVTDEEFDKLMRKIRELQFKVKNKLPVLPEPTEEMMLITPMSLTMVRAFAMQFTHDEYKLTGRTFSWGQAFHRLQSEGMVERLLQTQEKTYGMCLKIGESSESYMNLT